MHAHEKSIAGEKQIRAWASSEGEDEDEKEKEKTFFSSSSFNTISAATEKTWRWRLLKSQSGWAAKMEITY